MYSTIINILFLFFTVVIRCIIYYYSVNVEFCYVD